MSKTQNLENVDSLRRLLSEREKTLQRVRAVLGLAIGHLSTAAEGQEDMLNERIATLRQQVRNGLPTPATVNQLGLAAQAMSAIRRNRAEKCLRGLSACVAQLLSLDPPPEIKKELALFIAKAKRVISRPDQQAALVKDLGELQSKVFADVFQRDEQDSPHFDAAESDIETLYSDDTLSGLPAFSSVAETIENILTEMLVSIRAPESAEPALVKAKQILGAGLNWYELAALLEQIAIVVTAALDTDQREFEAFLQSLNLHLSTFGDSFEDLNAVGQSLLNSGESLDRDLRQNAEGLAENLERAESVESLQQSVQHHLDSMVVKLNEYQQERGELQSQYQQKIDAMQQRIDQLEQAAEEASKELEEQQRRTESDQLTGLPNRAAYDRRLAIEFERWERYRHNFCLVVADIDHFKLINDHYGHLAGDKVLKVVASTIRKRLRRVDYIARYGGEEFVILLPATDADTALKLIEELAEKVRSCPFHYNKQPLAITLSFGIAQAELGDNQESLFERADAALYTAKRAGRDKTVVASRAA